MIAFYSLLAILALYVVFVAAPTLVVCLSVFCKKQGIPLTERDLSATYYAPYVPRLRQEADWFESLPCRRVTACAFDGATLEADYYAAGSSKLVICMHGYGSTPLNAYSVMGHFLMDRGYDLLFVYQRGHGISGGKRSTMGILEQEDVLSWANWACGRPELDTVILAGQSMGCAAVSYASDRLQNPKIKGMILDCGFLSPYSQMRRTCLERHLPPKLMMSHVRFFAKHLLGIDITHTVTDSLRRTSIPALFMHGAEDRAVPLTEVQETFDACASPKQLYVAPSGRHACAFLMGGAEAEAAVATFLNSISG